MGNAFATIYTACHCKTGWNLEGRLQGKMSRYTHIFRGQESEAVSKLSDFGSASKERGNTATRTDGKE